MEPISQMRARAYPVTESHFLSGLDESNGSQYVENKLIDDTNVDNPVICEHFVRTFVQIPSISAFFLTITYNLYLCSSNIICSYVLFGFLFSAIKFLCTI